MTRARTARESARTLDAFGRGISREAHHLTRWPDLLRQQLLNDLQFADPPIPVVQEALELEATTPKRSWIRRRNAPRHAGAHGGALKYVLVMGTPTSCVVGPRNDFIAAGASDGTLTVWDARTGQEQSSFPLFDEALLGRVSAVHAPRPGGLELVGTTARGDVICLEREAPPFRLRDPVTAEVRAEARHSTWTTRACAMTESKALILLESNGDELRAWSDNSMVWKERDETPIRSANLDEQMVVSAAEDGAVAVREVGWRSDESEAYVAVPTRWRAPARSAAVVGCAVRAELASVLLAYEDGTVWIGNAWTGQEHGTRDLGTRQITSCALGSDFVVVGMADGSVHVLDETTLATRVSMEADESAVTACAASREGSLVVVGAKRSVKVVDAETGLQRAGFDAVSGDVLICGLSYDLGAVLMATDSGCVETWLLNDERLWFLWGGPYAVQACDTSLTGDFLSAVTADGVLRVWDTDSLVERAFPIEEAMSATCCALAPSGDLAVLGCDDGSLRVVDCRTGTERIRHHAHSERVQCSAFGPDGKFVVSGGADGMLKRWSVPELEEQLALKAHPVEVKSCAIAPDGRFLVSGPRGLRMGEPARIWCANSGEEIARLEGTDDLGVPACTVSPDGSLIVTAGWGGNALRAWRSDRLESGTEEEEEERGLAGGHACVFRPDGEVILTGWGKSLMIADSRTGEKRIELEGVGNPMFGAASPDGEFFVTGGRGGVVSVWDAHTGERRTVLTPHGGYSGFATTQPPSCYGLAVSPAGDLVFSDESLGGIRVWSLRSEDEWILDKKGGAFRGTPDGETIAVDGDGELAFLDIRTAEPVTSISAPGGLPTPDWSALVSSWDGTVRVWDLDSAEERGAVEVHESHGGRTEVHSAAITPDGQYVVTGSTDRTVRVTRLQEPEVIMTLPVLSSVKSMAAHPWLPLVACGDWTGALSLLELVGIEYDPIVVTPLDDGEATTVRCPKCGRSSRVERGLAGVVIECPTPECDLRLRITGLIAKPFSGCPAPELQVREREAELQSLDALWRLESEPAPEEEPTQGWLGRLFGKRRTKKKKPGDLLSRLEEWAEEERRR